MWLRDVVGERNEKTRGDGSCFCSSPEVLRLREPRDVSEIMSSTGNTAKLINVVQVANVNKVVFVIQTGSE